MPQSVNAWNSVPVPHDHRVVALISANLNHFLEVDLDLVVDLGVDVDLDYPVRHEFSQA